MHTITRDELVWSTRRVLLRWEEKDPSGKYGELLRLALGELAKENDEIRKVFETSNEDVVSALTRSGNAPEQAASEVKWYLLTMGYIVPTDSHIGGPNFSYFRLTALGREWADGSEPSPEDQQGFLTALKCQVTNLDPVIEQYLAEAVAAYGRRLYFAAAVMLGAASEKSIYLLADALVNSLTDQRKSKKLAEFVNQRKLFSMIETIIQYLEDAIKRRLIDFSIHEGAVNHLGSLMEAIRVQRNEAVHPNASKVVPATVRASLSSFPTAYKKCDDLVRWLRSNRI